MSEIIPKFPPRCAKTLRRRAKKIVPVRVCGEDDLPVRPPPCLLVLVTLRLHALVVLVLGHFLAAFLLD
jgi:hypothetical protein